MKVKSSRSSKNMPRLGKGMTRRIDPVAPPSARQTERRMATILNKLIAAGDASCVDEKFVGEYSKVQNLFSRYQREVLQGYPRKITCGAGCGVCCNHWPEDTYSFEVQYIADYLKKKRSSDIAGIIKTLRGDVECLDHIKKTVALRISDVKERAALGDIDPYDVALSSFYQMNRPCPLLDKNGSCSIYALRPLTCRVYVSFSQPALCRPGRILGDKAMTYLLDLEKDTSELFDRLHFLYDVYDGDTSLRSMLYKALTR